MKTCLSIALALLGAAAIHAADQLPLFSATLSMGKEQRFLLVSQPLGKPSGFLALGANFEGYTLKAFDPKSNTLDLEREGQVSHVSLVADAATGSAKPLATPATMADAENVFRVMRFDEMMQKMLEAQKKTMLPLAQQQMAQAMSRVGANLTEEDKAKFSAMQSKMLDQTLSAITSPEMREAMAKIYSDVFSKEELGSLAAFYATPGGQALVDKQPEVQQKMLSTMMPMIMQKQQSAQREMADFMISLKSKYTPSASAPADAPAAPAPKP